MKDITSTSFGLIIAYLLPGFVAVYSLTLCITKLNDVLNKFLDAKSDAGLFLLAVISALVVGLQVNVLRFLLFEKFNPWGPPGLSPDDYEGLKDAANLNSYLAVVEENYRFHQFYGCMAVVIPLLYYAWFTKYTITSNSFYRWLIVAICILIEFATIYTAYIARHRYITRTKKILSGKKDYSQEAKLEQEIRLVDLTLTTALIQRDAEALDRILSDNFIGTNITGRLANRTGFIQGVKNENIVYSSINLANTRVRVNADSAITTGYAIVVIKESGRNVSGLHQYAAFHIKRNGYWQVADLELLPIEKNRLE